MTDTWERCYEDSWDGLIVSEAFAHPAKYARGLIERIFREMLREGWIERGSTIADPFGGIASGGIVAAGLGLRWFGCELEEKFWKLGNANIELHRSLWEQFGDPVPVLVNGDSRQLRKHLQGPIAAVVSSPPYSESLGTPSLGSVNKDNWGKEGTSITARRGLTGEYGTTEGQLSTMKPGSVADAIVASPPFCGIVATGDPDFLTPGEQGKKNPSKSNQAGYGATKGQLGSMPPGSVDAICTSPPYAATAVAKSSDGVDLQKQYATYRDQGGGASFDAFCKTQRLHSGDYGSSDGQLSKLPSGEVDAVISSPPYASSLTGDNSQTETAAESQAKRVTPGGSLGASNRHSGYGGPGNLGNLPSGSVDSIVTSPPFADSEKCGVIDFEKRSIGTNNPGKHSPGRTANSYGQTDGQLGAMALGNLEAGCVDSVVTSPPYTKDALGHRRGEAGEQREATGKYKQGYTAGDVTKEFYGDAPGNLGNEGGETFWSAAAQILSESFAILKPGGYAAFVVKAFVRNKAIVDFPGDWRKLCESCGFVLVKEVRAMLTTEERHPDLFGGEDHVKTTKRASFFRRLYEKKYPENSIDWEVVQFFRKEIA